MDSLKEVSDVLKVINSNWDDIFEKLKEFVVENGHIGVSRSNKNCAIGINIKQKITIVRPVIKKINSKSSLTASRPVT